MKSLRLIFWLANFITGNFLKMVEGDVILIQFVSETISLVEENGVAKMDNGGIITLEVLVHNSFVDYYLLNWTLVSKSIIEFKSFYKLLFRGSVAFVSFEEGSAAGGGLNNFHGKMFDVIVILHCVVISWVCGLEIVVTSYVDSAFCT